MTDLKSARASIFDDDLDLTGFDTNMASHTKPDKEGLRAVAEAKGFSSRVSGPETTLQEPLLQRRYRTGRNRQLNLKVTDDALRRFYALADDEGLVLGEVFERAVLALEAQIKSKV
jgi:hypothetical protein